MTEFVQRSGDEMAFFKGREWLPRGVRYPDDDRTASKSAEEALEAAVQEVELAYHDLRLRGAVEDAVRTAKRAAASGGGDVVVTGGGNVMGERGVSVRVAAEALQSSVKGDVIAAVDTLCDLAEGVGTSQGEAAAAARDALDSLIGFAGSGDGSVAARRAAVAFIGGTGAAAGSAGLDAVAAVFRGDRSPGVRRTAGDALR